MAAEYRLCSCLCSAHTHYHTSFPCLLLPRSCVFVSPTVCSPVLLVDTGTPGWTVRYANLGWQELLQQHNRSQATMSWVEAASAAPPPTNTSNSGPLAVAPGGEAAADGGGAGADGGASASCAGLAAAAGEGKQQSNGRTTSPLQQAPVPVSDAILGRLLWPGIQQQLAREADGGKAMTQRLQQLLAAQQPFTLHGLELEGLGEQTASFVFRCVWFSEGHGGVSQGCGWCSGVFGACA